MAESLPSDPERLLSPRERRSASPTVDEPPAKMQRTGDATKGTVAGVVVVFRDADGSTRRGLVFVLIHRGINQRAATFPGRFRAAVDAVVSRRYQDAQVVNRTDLGMDLSTESPVIHAEISPGVRDGLVCIVIHETQPVFQLMNNTCRVELKTDAGLCYDATSNHGIPGLDRGVANLLRNVDDVHSKASDDEPATRSGTLTAAYKGVTAEYNFVL